MPTPNYYETLGVKSSATEQEIRRAYRILARRYHPDVNPVSPKGGSTAQQSSDPAEKFKLIAEAYRVLTDPEKRKQHDLLLNLERIQQTPRGHRVYSDEMKRKFQQQSKAYTRPAEPEEKSPHQRRAPSPKPTSTSLLGRFQNLLRTPISQLLPRAASNQAAQQPNQAPPVMVRSVSVVEVSLSIFEAITGTKKSLEIPDGERTSKVSIRIPAGITNGSTIRMRSDKLRGQELICIIRIADHPGLALNENGLVIDLPVTVGEAYHGVTLDVPTLTGTMNIRVPPRSQSGLLIPLRNQGPKMRSGTTGDLLYRVVVHAPRDGAAPQYEALLKELDHAYSQNLRGELLDALSPLLRQTV